MRTLCLFRHAKSTWGALGTDDIDRPLHPIGSTNAPMMGNFLKNQKIKPDLILSSNATRCLATAELIAEPLNYKKENIKVDPRLYDASVEDLLQVLEGIDNKFKTVILVGHNPGLTLLANYLAEGHVVNLPTCGVFCLDIDMDDWKNITSAKSEVKFIDEPRRH